MIFIIIRCSRPYITFLNKYYRLKDLVSIIFQNKRIEKFDENLTR